MANKRKRDPSTSSDKNSSESEDAVSSTAFDYEVPGQESDSDSDHAGGSGESSRSRGLLGEALKKIMSVGLGAAFMSEEGIRNYLAELKLPKEILNSLIHQAGKSKDDLMLKVGREISGILSKIDVVEEVSKFAENHKFKVSAEIEIIKKDKKP